MLDAPVSGGRPGALEHRLTTLVGGPEPVARRCEPVFGSFSRHVVYIGGAGSGQAAKLFNNALMIMNHASIADVVEVAAGFGMDPVRLVEVLKLGSAFSVSMSVLNTMITPETVDHLAGLEEEDMEVFAAAMTEAGVNADTVTARGLDGARRLPELISRLNP